MPSVKGVLIAGVSEMDRTELAGYRDPVPANAMSIARAANDAGVDVHDIDVVLTYDSLVKPDILQANRVAEYLGVNATVAATVGRPAPLRHRSPHGRCAAAERPSGHGRDLAHSDLRSTAGREQVIAMMAANVGNPEVRSAVRADHTDDVRATR